MADTESSSSSSKPLIVRVKRKSSQSPLEALWLEISERPLKRPLVDFDKLSITDSTKSEIFKSKKVLVQHVETVGSSKASLHVLQSIVVPNSDEAVDFKSKVEERRQTFKQENKQDQLLLRAREKHEDMAKNARFEQIWKKRRGKDIHELCNIYDVVRVDEEEEIPKKVEQAEDISAEDSQILCNFLPLLREYLPEVASEIQSDIHSYINNSEAMMDDYVYDLYAVKDEMNTAEDEDALNAYPLVQVGEDDDYYDGPSESEWDTSDSNAEDNPLNEYPDEVSSSEEDTEEEEDEDDEDEDDEEEDEDKEGVTCVNGFRELDEFSKTKIPYISEDEYSYEDEDEDTLADDDEDDDEDSWKWKHR